MTPEDENLERLIGEMIDAANSARNTGNMTEDDYQRRMESIGAFRQERLRAISD